jgi:hypothetical protein
MIKNIILIVALMTLTGCQTVKNIQSLLPRDHDPTLAGAFVETKIEINTLNCEAKDSPFENMKWEATKASSVYLKEYAIFRGDPQQESAIAVNTNLEKASKTDKVTVCNHWLNLTKIRIQTLEKAWSGR